MATAPYGVSPGQQHLWNYFDSAQQYGYPPVSLGPYSKEIKRISTDKYCSPPQLESETSSPASLLDYSSISGDFSTETSISSPRQTPIYSSRPPSDFAGLKQQQLPATAWNTFAPTENAHMLQDCSQYASPTPGPIIYKEPSWLCAQQYLPGPLQHPIVNHSSWPLKQVDPITAPRSHVNHMECNGTLGHFPTFQTPCPPFTLESQRELYDLPSTREPPISPCSGVTARAKTNKRKASMQSQPSKRSKVESSTRSPNKKAKSCSLVVVPKSRQHTCNEWDVKENRRCQKGFHRPEHLIRHQKSHLPAGEKDYFECPLCDKNIENRLDNMKSHLKNIHYTPTEQKEDKGKANKRIGMLAVLRTATDPVARPKWINYFKKKNKVAIIIEKDLQRLIRDDDDRWRALLADELTIDHNLKRQKAWLGGSGKENQYPFPPGVKATSGLGLGQGPNQNQNQNHNQNQNAAATVPSRWWKMVDWTVPQGLETPIKSVAPEYEGPHSTLWQLDPRAKALEAGTFRMDDCVYLRTSMREMWEVRLDHLDPRWIAVREGDVKMERKDVVKEGIERIWDVGVGVGVGGGVGNNDKGRASRRASRV